MPKYEYDIVDDEKCSECGCIDDIVMNDDGDYVCTDCLFESTTNDILGYDNG